MVDFTLNEKDEEILNEIRRQGLVRRKYARYYDEHEDEIPPAELPEAKDFDHIPKMYLDRAKHEGACTPAAFGILAAIQGSWGGGVPATHG